MVDGSKLRLTSAFGVVLVYWLACSYPFDWDLPRLIQNAAVRVPDGGVRLENTGRVWDEDPPPWIETVRRTGRVEIEFEARAFLSEQSGPARILTLSRGAKHRNFTFAQDGQDFVLRLRTPTSDANGKPIWRIKGLWGDRNWHEIRLRIEPGSVELSADGTVRETRTIGAEGLSVWDPTYPLLIGNEFISHRPWLGELRRARVKTDVTDDLLAPGRLGIDESYWFVPYHMRRTRAGLSRTEWWRDAIFNLVGFVPLGFFLVRVLRTNVTQAAMWSLLVSAMMEANQLLLASRITSRSDVIWNTLGALGGAWLASWILKRRGTNSGLARDLRSAPANMKPTVSVAHDEPAAPDLFRQLDTSIADSPKLATPPERELGKILVTGVTGCAGGNLARLLRDHGDDVRGLLRDGSGAAWRNAGFEVAEGDLRDEGAIRRAMEGIQTVYHVAAAFRKSGLTEKEFDAVNVDGTRHLLDSALAAGVERFVHVSTVGVQGHIENPPADENAPMGPGDAYQRSKLRGEQLALSYHAERGLPVSVVRPAGIYGPADTRFLKLFRSIAKGRFVMIGGGQPLYHLTFISDMCEGIRLAGDKKVAVGRVYTIAGPEIVTLQELVQRVASACGVAAPKWRVPFAPVYAASVLCEQLWRVLPGSPPLYPRRVDFFRKDRAFDISRARAELDFDPKVGLDEGLKITAAWYRAQGLL